MKDYYFTVCEVDGNLDWFEFDYDKNTSKKKTRGLGPGRINHLTRDGLQQYPNKIDIKTVSKKNVFMNEDFICTECEQNLIPIPFSEIGLNQRIKIFNMSREDRIAFANSYKMVKTLEKSNEKDRKV